MDHSTRVVVLSGAGRAFLAGGDISSFHRGRDEAENEIASVIAHFHDAVESFTSMAKPLIAQVHGAVAGGGVSLMLAADLVICADDAHFTLAYSRLGTCTDGGASWSVPRIVGLRQALEIALLDERLNAADALRLGLINRVVPAADLEQETRDLAERLALGPTEAFGHLKRLLRTSFERSFSAQLSEEAASYNHCARQHDFREGVAAFLEKRAPHFRGS
jgi:2-(1,2-epoxy-1,2-dihydrophenyl)acetyl-CoA isomerase